MSESKKRVLIVDDEYRVCLLIRELIDWDGSALVCACVFDNSEEAFQYLQVNDDIDIVISDICMPKVSGLDLIRMTKEIRPRIRYVLISGYKEFEYARQAMRYGVEHYVLKPFSAEELNAALSDLCNKIDQSEGVRNSDQLRKQIQNTNRILRRHYLSNILEGRKIQGDERIPLPGDTFRCLDIKLDEVDNRYVQAEDDVRMSELIPLAVESNCQTENINALTCKRDDHHFCCLLNYNSWDEKNVWHCLNDLLSALQDCLSQQDIFIATIGISAPFPKEEEIGARMQEAYIAVCDRMRLGTGRLIYAGERPAVYDLNMKRAFDILGARINADAQQNVKDFRTAVRETLYEPFQNGDLDGYCVYSIAEQIADSVYVLRPWADCGQMDDAVRELKHMIQNCASMGQIEDMLCDYYDTCLGLIESEGKEKLQRPIRLVLKYIDEHYADKISLEEAARLADLSPAYFSTLFKKETDENFSTYLAKKRMDEACKLLTKTNDIISVIAEKVGYGDARHFSQVFQKTVGVKPSIYRKIHG